jgi:hypothetical protein
VGSVSNNALVFTFAERLNNGTVFTSTGQFQVTGTTMTGTSSIDNWCPGCTPSTRSRATESLTLRKCLGPLSSGGGCD